ncbi:MAG: Sec-independent protein translocase subunit TatA [Actinobacteria bacterium]|nr:Sec-independent protein translocase subunit TatA [Actinomycetota bacterium]
MGSLSPAHWLAIAVIALLLFGYKRLPDAARSLGRSMRIFKSEVSELRNDDRPRPDDGGARSSAAPTTPTTPVIEGEAVRRDEAVPREGAVRAEQARAEAPRREE